MARTKWTVEDRQKSLQPIAPKADFTLAGMRAFYKAGGGKEFYCTISRHCRTQVFEFPRIAFRPDGDEPHHTIYASSSVQACLASNLVDYFANATCSRHYDISPNLRHVIAETDEKVRSQQNDVPVFVVIKEDNELAPVEMINGECCLLDEVMVRNGEKIPALIGGREGEQVIAAWPTVDGAWPELPSNQQLVNLILAGVRVAQETPDPIRKYVEQDCLVTDDGRFVAMMPPATLSARLGTAKTMDTKAYRAKASEIKKAIAAMELDVATPHMALLINSMYRDEFRDDAYQRLYYLGLWQSLADAARTCLNYRGNISQGDVAVAGNKTLEELNQYRDAIAHWRTDTIDENFLADLQQTINELMRRRYF